jgi:hypothetical protein
VCVCPRVREYKWLRTAFAAYALRTAVAAYALRTAVAAYALRTSVAAFVRASSLTHVWLQARALVQAFGLGEDRAALGPDDRAALNALFDEALAKFGKTPTLLVMIAGFHLGYGRNVHLALKACSAALRMEPAPDEALRLRVITTNALAYEARTVIGAAAANTQLAYRVRAEAAEVAVLAFARAQKRLFVGLRAAVVDLSEILRVSRDLVASYTRALESYKAALELLPSSTGTMRACAAFLAATYNRSAAATLLSTADTVDGAQRKKADRVYRRVTWKLETNVDIALESNAVIQVSIDEASVGAVLSANVAACRLFGYSQQVCVPT